MTPKEKVQKNIEKNLASICFFMYSIHGLPFDVTKDILEKNLKNDKEKLNFTLTFYEKNKKWCEKNDYIVDYNKVIK